jgi:hypothetical protein
MLTRRFVGKRPIMTSDDTIDAEFTPVDAAASASGGARRWMVAIAIALGLLVLLGGALWWMAMRPQPTAAPATLTTINTMEKRLAALEARGAGQGSGDDLAFAPAIDAVRSRLDALEVRLASVEAGLGTASVSQASDTEGQGLGSIDALSARVEALESQLHFDLTGSDVPSAAAGGTLPARGEPDVSLRLADIETRLAALNVAQSDTPQAAAQWAMIVERLKRLETAPRTAPVSSQDTASSPDTTALARLQTQIGDLQSALADLRGEQSAGPDAALTARLDRLSSALSVLSREATGVDLVAAPAQPELTLAVEGLKAAIAEGRPFAREWAELDKAGLPDAVPSGVRSAFARNSASGVASRARLRERLAVLSVKQTAARPDPLAQMRSVIGGVIQRQDATGAKADAALDNARGALGSGDLAEAIAALSVIEGSSSVEDWRSAATARLEVERALTTLKQNLQEGPQ